MGLATSASAAPRTAAADPVVSYFQTHRGAMPTVAEQAHIRSFLAAHPDAATTAAATSANTLYYGGGVNGQGVMSGAKTKVYLVFYGSQWGTQGTDANGNATFTGDPSRVASVAQQMFKGIGTNGETWSADLTQWCDGPGVSTGVSSCPTSLPAAQFVPYQSGGTLAGVWYDNAAPEPTAPNGHALAQEANNAAGHFGNTTSAANRNAYYVILSAHGTNPDNYQGQYCAWHDWNNDSANLSGGAAPSSYGTDIAFSNQPYNTDSGAGCGVGFVNGSSGTTDGYSMTLGHEWHEMMSDTYPNTAWSSSTGYENSDECAWLNPGTTGGAANISFGSYGTYAEQASWSNDTNSCAISHQILTHGGGGQGDTVTVTSPGNQTATVGTPVSVQVQASDSASGQTLTYSESGLPTGLSINSSTGLISGTPTVTGTSSVTVTAKDTTGAAGSTSFTWAVNPAGGGSVITNGGFETGSLSGWSTAGTASVTNSGAHSGTYAASLGDGVNATNGDSSASQTFTATNGGTLSFWYDNICPDTVTYDWATATLKDNTTGTTTTVLAKTCVYDSGWKQVTKSLTAGHSYTLKLVSHDDDYSGDPTVTLYDDVTVS